jgi:alginate O-acetyltransferase complex protein AlgI
MRTGNAGDLIVPLGMSYYTFRLLHVAIDAYRRKSFEYLFQDYVCYVFLFTIIVAGPIQRFDEFLRNTSIAFTKDHLLHGGTRVVFGLIKQTVVIDSVFWIRDEILSRPLGALSLDLLAQMKWQDLWVVLIAAYVSSYLNLSAYTDIAIGSSRLFGFTISENFNWPIAATSITDFWRRWHMTLTGWCQNYVYFPVLGLSRNPYAAIIASFLAIGLWHVMTFNRVAWGCFHAAGVIGVSLLRRTYRKSAARYQQSFIVIGFSWLLTQAFVSASWIFVIAERSNDLKGSLSILLRLIGIG